VIATWSWVLSGPEPKACFSSVTLPFVRFAVHQQRGPRASVDQQPANALPADALSQVPALRVVNVKGKPLLTAREEQVVALVADGLSNRKWLSSSASANTPSRNTCCASLTSSGFDARGTRSLRDFEW